MRVDVNMPQMGESIAEGTITRWIKKVGERVERDEPIFEISTDKVDAEIPSPSAGVIVEVRSNEGDTVEVNSVVAVIETETDAASTQADVKQPVAASATPAPPAPPDSAPSSGGGAAVERSVEAPATTKPARFVSPVVRRIADEHGIDPGRIPGSGSGGRVTKKDILAFIKSGAPAPAPAASAPPEPPSSLPTFGPATAEVREKMSVMRRKIAEHMIESRRTSAHVHSVFEVDMSRVVQLRSRYKGAYVERHGVNLTYTAFLIKAICAGLRSWPVINASVAGDEIVYKRELNIGIAVALDWGLIVPVVRNADELSLSGLSRRVQDLAQRARNKQLNPDDVQGGTFTITNPGQFGGLFGLPIINQPQVAILGVGGIEKRPVVVDDAIAIRSMMYLALSYDHRVVDGAVADQFMAQIKGLLQTFDEALL